MNARGYISKYKAPSGQSEGGITIYSRIKATEKWLEYMLDKNDINNILMQSDFNTKVDLLEVLEVLDRKIAYMYKHPNFKFNQATTLFHRLKNIEKVG